MNRFLHACEFQNEVTLTLWLTGLLAFIRAKKAKLPDLSRKPEILRQLTLTFYSSPRQIYVLLF